MGIYAPPPPGAGSRPFWQLGQGHLRAGGRLTPVTFRVPESLDHESPWGRGTLSNPGLGGLCPAEVPAGGPCSEAEAADPSGELTGEEDGAGGGEGPAGSL